MPTYHIHISGLVQGVGFRPLVCRLAENLPLTGWVINSNDGVHIEVNGTERQVKKMYQQLLSHPPKHAVITHHRMYETRPQTFSGFSIRHSNNIGETDLLLTPDIALCEECRNEINDAGNRRHNYAFTTCLSCGPRYSIMQALPYDRERTSMAPLAMCSDCTAEYHDFHNRRHYSQTNSCPQCAIPMHLYNADAQCICHDADCILGMVNQALREGHIVAVKGIGGYLLLTDARRPLSIEALRQRKQRPAKPFALLYPDLPMAGKDVWITEKEKKALLSDAAPIVLCRRKPKPKSGIATSLIAPGLHRLGIMLPYSPLLYLISRAFNAPLVATSGNLSGSPIIFSDDEALLYLTDFADFVLSFDRDILSAQDDSVMQFSEIAQQPIILRRSRGWAPNYLKAPLNPDRPALATGADMKGAFALYDGRHTYISQYLGDQGKYESQENYRLALLHLMQLVSANPKQIITDMHPGYASTAYGHQLSERLGVPVLGVQHHRAHFAAVLAENQMLNESGKVLGVIWDGTGYGDDEQIWGGEFFVYAKKQMKRLAHLQYFPQLLGDKMSREPRLSALSLLFAAGMDAEVLRDRFTLSEWSYYHKLLEQPDSLQTSSMGRLIDGLAVLIGLPGINNYEAETAMRMEALASAGRGLLRQYALPLENGQLNWKPMLQGIMNDRADGLAAGDMAWKILVTLVVSIRTVAESQHIRKLAFSGGVFQNALLVDLVHRMLGNDFELFFHRALSPNDENISFGQLAMMEAGLIPSESGAKALDAVIT